jgi:hypothetical protein
MDYGNIAFTTIGLGFLVGLAVGASACVPFSEPNPNHCAQQDGDAACKKKFGDERPYCVMCGEGAYDNDGCVEKQPTNLECYSPCGEMQSHEENSSCITFGEGDGDGDGDDGGDGDGDGGDEPMPCMGPEDCSDATPFCDSGECVDCDGMPADACMGLSADTPVCADGACVQCDAGDTTACEHDKPICEMNACVACTEHEQCPSSACNLSVGNCIEQVLHVDGNDDVDCVNGDGSADKPYCELGEALSASSGEALIFIHAKSEGKVYQEVNTVGDDTIVLFGVPSESGERPILQGLKNGLPVLLVEQGGNLSLRDVQISGSDAEGLRVAGNAWIEQSFVINNDEGGIVVDGGTLVVENSFVGGHQDDEFAVNVMAGSATMTYVTLAGGHGMAAALICADDTTTVVRNSLLVAQTDDSELQCTDAQVSDSALEEMVTGNVALGPMNTDWFEDYEVGDFHLTDNPPETINMAARWRTGDPVTDIEDDDRPMTDDSPDFAGADVPN